MKIHTELRQPSVKFPILTIGTFDGVHHGHKSIIERLKLIAQSVGGSPALLTFYPHPRMVLHPDDHDLQLLNTPEEKAELLEKAGIEHLYVYPFSEDFSRLSAFDYVRDLIVNGIHAHTVVVGYDHRYGRNREGDFKTLKEFSEVFNFQVLEIPAQEIDEINVSSTKIRQALLKGDVMAASKWLGYNYRLSGTVVHGDGRGNSIGFPTANLNVHYPYKLIPGNGVYAVRVCHQGQLLNGVTNIGIRPTLHQQSARHIETHLLNFNQTIYGENISIEFVGRIREEQKFGSIDALIEQIRTDIFTAQQWF